LKVAGGFTALVGRQPTIHHLPLAPAVMSRVNSKTQRHISRAFYSLDDFLTPVQPTANVELEYLWMLRACGDFLQTRLGHRADEIHCAEFGRGFGNRDTALRSDRLQRADGRHHHGNP
jgi:hypothetical protein